MFEVVVFVLLLVAVARLVGPREPTKRAQERRSKRR